MMFHPFLQLVLNHRGGMGWEKWSQSNLGDEAAVDVEWNLYILV